MVPSIGQLHNHWSVCVSSDNVPRPIFFYEGIFTHYRECRSIEDSKNVIHGFFFLRAFTTDTANLPFVLILWSLCLLSFISLLGFQNLFLILQSIRFTVLGESEASHCSVSSTSTFKNQSRRLIMSGVSLNIFQVSGKWLTFKYSLSLQFTCFLLLTNEVVDLVQIMLKIS